MYEIKTALKQTKNNKAPGLDEVIIQMIKNGTHTILHFLELLFNLCLDSGRISTA